MLLERVLEAASPGLSGRRVRAVRIGPKIVGAVLDDGRFGAGYHLPGERPGGSPPVEETAAGLAALAGRPALAVARRCLPGQTTFDRALGLALCNAVAEPDPSRCLVDPDAAAAVPARATDTVGFVGYVGTVVRRVQAEAARTIIFDRSQEDQEDVYPEERQPELLPQCDLVFITGSALINCTLERLLTYCTRAREIVLIGPSTPLYPEAFSGSGVTVLAGFRWQVADPDEALAQIAAGAHFKHLKGRTSLTLRVEEPHTQKAR
ncbi:Rossmann-like domain-containing protein [Symbiobacterium terraclitae]|uniref:Rossmann-like domain-containing protein n=1 Tax=Symbiobacterium terraclitae TaxID=557451 RepID=UPI0035B51F47